MVESILRKLPYPPPLKETIELYLIISLLTMPSIAKTVIKENKSRLKITHCLGVTVTEFDVISKD